MSRDNKPTNKKRLLFMRRTTSFAGSETVVVELLKAIDYQRNSVVLASLTDVFSGVLADLKLPVTSVPLTPPFKGRFLTVFFSWIRYLVRLRPDKIILAEGGFGDFSFPAVLAAFACARGNLWMLELHPAPEPDHKIRLHWGLKRRMGQRVRGWLARGILSVSQGIKDRLVRGYGYTPEKIGVVYNGIDTERFSPASDQTRRALRRSLEIPEDATVVVSAARLDPIKRLERLIQAFGVLSVEHQDLWLLLTGDGPLSDELKALARSVGNDDKIRFLGQVEDVCAVLRGSDIFVLPSDEEGFGIALVEAMACELVSVATRTVGPSEIVEHGRNGFLTERTYEGVLEGLRQALKLSHRERKAMGSRARQTVLDKFRIEQATAKALAFLEINPATGIAQSFADPV